MEYSPYCLLFNWGHIVGLRFLCVQQRAHWGRGRWNKTSAWYFPKGSTSLQGEGGGGGRRPNVAGGRVRSQHPSVRLAPFTERSRDRPDRRPRLLWTNLHQHGDCHRKGAADKAAQHLDRQGQERLRDQGCWGEREGGNRGEGVWAGNLGKSVRLCLFLHRLCSRPWQRVEVPVPLLQKWRRWVQLSRLIALPWCQQLPAVIKVWGIYVLVH